jgi:hypothetical protein
MSFIYYSTPLENINLGIEQGHKEKVRKVEIRGPRGEGTLITDTDKRRGEVASIESL